MPRRFPHTATNQAQLDDKALSRLQDAELAVAVLDLQRYGLDGFKTARLIRCQEKSRHTPTIFLIALAGDESPTHRGTPSSLDGLPAG